MEKDGKLSKLPNEVYYLTAKVNELERYSSEDSILIINLPLLSGSKLVEDVIKLMQNNLQIQVNQFDLIAFHFLKPYKSTVDSPSVRVNFVHFWKKNTLFGHKNIG